MGLLPNLQMEVGGTEGLLMDGLRIYSYLDRFESIKRPH